MPILQPQLQNLGSGTFEPECSVELWVVGKERERLEHTVLLALTLERLTTKAVVVSVGGGKGGRKKGRTDGYFSWNEQRRRWLYVMHPPAQWTAAKAAAASEDK